MLLTGTLGVLLSACAAGPQTRRAEMLAQYPVLAVTGLDVKVVAEKSQQERLSVSFAGRGELSSERKEKLRRLTAFIAAFDPHAARKVRRSLRGLASVFAEEAAREGGGSASQAPASGAGQGKSSSETAIEPGLHEYTVDRLNRGFTRRGYTPIQRERIDAVRDEQALALSGYTAEDAEVGRLVRADAVVRGRLTIRLISRRSLGGAIREIFGEGGSPCELLFSGDITSVEHGYILYSHAVSAEEESFSASAVERVIERWFEELPPISVH
jgi:hypothetical protein